ncbi:MAG TPA: aspartate aminotransferase family protein [Fimbriimonadaceae bacterium]|nr:aspartate aminotransferase family protein [Fimbriimonadaceae bacterium]
MSPDQRHADVLEKYSRFVNPYLAKLMHFAGFGLEVQGEGCYIIDHEGRRFLDCLGGYGVYALGHRHPKVIEAVKRQLDLMPLSGKAFFNANLADLAAKIAEITPSGLELTFFSNSGAEAVEAALKFVKASTRRTKIVATDGGYHGKTIGALSVTGREKYRRPFEPLMPGGVFVPYGDVDAIVGAIDGDTAACIIEPIQGEGGIHVPPDGYLRAIREACDRHGALMIADEVQTGLGRTGDLFGCDHDRVSPDVMTLAKAFGGGVMPIGATVATPAVFERVYSENPLAHTSTFGGNPLACAAGLASIQVVEEEGLCERARLIGGVLREGLQSVADRHTDLVSEVRGRGLMIGVEFTMDDVGELTIAQMVKRGLVAAYTLNNRRVIRFEPPLIMTEAQAVWAAETFGEALAETAEVLATLV